VYRCGATGLSALAEAASVAFAAALFIHNRSLSTFRAQGAKAKRELAFLRVQFLRKIAFGLIIQIAA
jgi:hypothetical protein